MSPVIWQVNEADDEHLNDPGDETTLNRVMELPLLFPESHWIDAWPFPGIPVTIVGASGTAAGVTGELAEESGLLPAAFSADTLKVNASPFFKPPTTHSSGDVAEHGVPAEFPFLS